MKTIITIVDEDFKRMRPPSWYGFAYRRWDTRETVLAVIPFNLVVRYAVKAYWILYRFAKYSGWDDKVSKAYWDGYSDGYDSMGKAYDALRKRIRELEMERK